VISVNWTQVIAQAFATAIITPVATVSTFVVMRYFPKIWEQVEKSVTIKNDTKNNIKKG